MSAAIFKRISALIGSLMVAVFVLGLAAGISSGFAGFWGGLPFWVISLSVLVLVVYDLWDSTIRKKKPSD
jgi:sterol desaturase/sphingolipid hydroxylase (fatty acid hydroxylase superfamily)